MHYTAEYQFLLKYYLRSDSLRQILIKIIFHIIIYSDYLCVYYWYLEINIREKCYESCENLHLKVQLYPSLICDGKFKAVI